MTLEHTVHFRAESLAPFELTRLGLQALAVTHEAALAVGDVGQAILRLPSALGSLVFQVRAARISRRGYPTNHTACTRAARLRL